MMEVEVADKARKRAGRARRDEPRNAKATLADVLNKKRRVAR